MEDVRRLKNNNIPIAVNCADFGPDLPLPILLGRSKAGFNFL
jgi:hypothetical protein